MVEKIFIAVIAWFSLLFVFRGFSTDILLYISFPLSAFFIWRLCLKVEILEQDLHNKMSTLDNKSPSLDQPSDKQIPHVENEPLQKKWTSSGTNPDNSPTTTQNVKIPSMATHTFTPVWASTETLETPPLSENRSKTIDKIILQQKIDNAMLNDKKTNTQNPQRMNTFFQFLTQKNGFAKIGIFVLLIGIGFLFKYINDTYTFPPESRLLGSCILAVTLMSLGWRLRHSKPLYGVLLQGGGIGVFYIAIFAAFRLYQLLPAPLAFVLLVSLAVFSSMLSILQNARSLAIASLGGAFLAPIIASDGSGSYILLFSYYALVNLGVFIIARFKNWPLLNILGFSFTFLISAIWGLNYYQPTFFNTVEPFLILFFVEYFTITLLETKQQLENSLKPNYVLIFSFPTIAFILQGGLVNNMPYGLSASALCCSAFYLITAISLHKKLNSLLKPLIESYLGISIFFLTVFLFFSFSGGITAAFWAIEGLVLVATGIRQKNALMRNAGMILQIIATILFLWDTSPSSIALGQLPLLNSFFSSIILFTVCTLLTRFLLEKSVRDQESNDLKDFSTIFFILGIFSLTVGGAIELHRDIPIWYQYVNSLPLDKNIYTSLWIQSYIIYLSFCMIVLYPIGLKLSWASLTNIRAGFIPLLCCIFIYELPYHSSYYSDSIAWFIAFITHFGLLKYQDTHIERDSDLYLAHKNSDYTLSFWLIICLLTHEVHWQTLQASTLSALKINQMVDIIIPSIACLSILRPRTLLRWPIITYKKYYLKALQPVFIFIFLTSLYLNFTISPYNGLNLSYIPFVDPIDITQLLALITIGYGYLKFKKSHLPFLLKPHHIIYMFGAQAFVWISALTVRTVSSFLNLLWDGLSIWGNSTIQTTISILWTIIALNVMLYGKKRALRVWWFGGTILLTIVIAKLFFIDLSNTGTLARIISFIGTGLLLLIIGYLTPTPQTDETNKEEEKS